MTVMEVALFTANNVAAVAPNVTAVAAVKLVPVIVTIEPPAVGPELELTFVTAGVAVQPSANRSNSRILSCGIVPGVVHSFDAGSAGCEVNNLPIGEGAMTATYSGDANNFSSGSSGLDLTILDPINVICRNSFEQISAGCPAE